MAGALKSQDRDFGTARTAGEMKPVPGAKGKKVAQGSQAMPDFSGRQNLKIAMVPVPGNKTR